MKTDRPCGEEGKRNTGEGHSWLITPRKGTRQAALHKFETQSAAISPEPFCKRNLDFRVEKNRERKRGTERESLSKRGWREGRIWRKKRMIYALYCNELLSWALTEGIHEHCQPHGLACERKFYSFSISTNDNLFSFRFAANNPS